MEPPSYGSPDSGRLILVSSVLPSVDSETLKRVPATSLAPLEATAVNVRAEDAPDQDPKKETCESGRMSAIGESCLQVGSAGWEPSVELQNCPS